ncbi:MAG: MFS transporter, partial [Actinomycetota bacterium]|nr:MFS transporter [Actinomycetota bacterium]
LNDALAWGLVPLYLSAHGAEVGSIGLVAGIYPAVWGAAQIGTGAWSDRAGSRLRPMRQVAAAAVVVLLLFALGDAVAGRLAVVALAAGAIVTVAPNGLAFTATAEIAGSTWSGRALGIQNTGQNAVASVVPVVLGALVGATGYAPAFALAALAPLAAVALVPVGHEPIPRW